MEIMANTIVAQKIIISYLIEEHNKKKSPAKEPDTVPNAQRPKQVLGT
jgi:hypothetical protein